MTETEMLQWIDTADYEGLLRRWRMDPAGSPWFQGEIGAYYFEMMAARGEDIDPAERVRVSKAIGWGG